MIYRGAFFSLVCAFSTAAFAGVAPVVASVKQTTPPVIDGEIKAGEWPDSAMQSGLIDSSDKRPSSVPVSFWLTYDDKAIYFAAKVTQDPTTVRREQTRQNAGFPNDDTVTLGIDATGIGRSFDSFTMNANTGNSLELVGGRANKTEWLGKFESRGALTSDGWVVEARIPWELITRRPSGLSDLRFNVSHYSADLKRESGFHFDSSNTLDVPRWQQVQIPVIRVKSDVKLLPYTVFAAGRGEKLGIDSGIDFKIELPDSKFVVGTVNPDDRNIENTFTDLSFSYFERLSDENRPFFAEGKNFFQNTFRVFNSRRIRGAEAGIKYYGNLDKDTTFGLMHLNDIGNESTTVFSMTTAKSNKFSIGTAVADHAEDGKNNLAYRLGVRQQFAPNLSIGIDTTHTRDTARGSGQLFSGSVSYNNQNTYAEAFIQTATKDYFPRMGYAPETNYKDIGFNMSAWKQYRGGQFSAMNIWLGTEKLTRLDSGDKYRSESWMGGNLTFRNNMSVSLNHNFGYFEEFNDHSWEVGANFNVYDPYRQYGFSYGTGTAGGEDFDSQGVYASFRPYKDLYGSLNISNYNRGENSRRVSSTWRYELNKYESLTAKLIDDRGDLNWFATYRMGGKEGPEYTVIFGDPRARTFRARIAAKVTYPFTL